MFEKQLFPKLNKKYKNLLEAKEKIMKNKKEPSVFIKLVEDKGYLHI